MKRRTMKKWIPKDTVYCYQYDKKGNMKTCKWWVSNTKQPYQMNGYCKYLNKGDWFKYGTNLLFDKCKEC